MQSSDAITAADPADKMGRVKTQVDELKDIMVKNIGMVFPTNGSQYCAWCQSICNENCMLLKNEVLKISRSTLLKSILLKNEVLKIS